LSIYHLQDIRMRDNTGSYDKETKSDRPARPVSYIRPDMAVPLEFSDA